jgi:tetratricopeptide (TPR) repeat protein
MSAVHLDDGAVADQMLTRLAAKAGAPAATAAGGAHADHGGAPPAPAANAAPDAAKAPRIMHHELAALIALKKADKDQAVSLLREAAAIEESMRPPNGAADPVKPAHELLGEVLLEVGKPAEAAEAFDTCLLRMPNRARSLMGAARAHAAAGHKELADARYKTLTSFWKGGPIGRPPTDAR